LPYTEGKLLVTWRAATNFLEDKKVGRIAKIHSLSSRSFGNPFPFWASRDNRESFCSDPRAGFPGRGRKKHESSHLRGALQGRTLLGEVGPDFSKFRSASAFASWLGICPDNEISGGKVLWVGTRKVNCRAATALRMAAQSLHHSKTVLVAFYRRLRTKLGAPKAITAGAHKLARIIFHLVTTQQEFDESRFAADQLRHQKRQEAKLRTRAWALGFQLVPLDKMHRVP